MRKLTLFVLITVLLLAGCAPAAQIGSVREQVVSRAITSEPSGLDPQGVAGSGQNVILPYLFDTLVYLDTDNSYKPYLAEKWVQSPDGKQLTFTLRKGILFQDGTPLNAQAVKFTYDRLIQQGQKSVLASAVAIIDNIEVVDDLTFRFNFKEPTTTFMSSLTNPYAGIVSPTAVKNEGEEFGRKPVGSGAFSLEKWEPGVSITLVRNPKYAWPPAVMENQGAPHLDKLVFKIIPDVSQQLTAFQAGELDVLFVNQPNHVAALKKDVNTNLVETTLNSLIYLGFNCQKAPFDDVRVRQALSHAVNKAELVQTALGGIGKPAFAPLAPTLPGFDTSLKSSEMNFDLAKAKELLQEAGFTANPDGIMEKDGKPLTTILLTSTRPPNQALATVLQSQLKAIGVQAEIQQLDSAAAQAAMTKGNYDLMLWRYDWNDADVLQIYLSSARIGSTNRNFYNNSEVDQQLSQAGQNMDEAARKALYLQAQQAILQDAPWQPLYTPTDFIAIRKEVSGVVIGPMGRILLNDATRQ